MAISILKKYFRYDAKNLKLEVEKHELYKQIRAINAKQRKIREKQYPYEKEVRFMFNNGVFTNYGDQTNIEYRKLIVKK